MEDNTAGRHPGSRPTLTAAIKSLLVLGLPLIGAQLAQMLINVVDTVMMGWLGTRELAAGTLAFQFFFILWIFGSGFAFAIVPMAATAVGRGDEVSVRRHVRMGMWVQCAYFALIFLPMGYIREILIAFGQEPVLAGLAQDYMDIAKWAILPSLLLMVLRSFATALEHARIILVITLFSALLNGVLNYAFIFGNFGAPRLEIPGAALATLLTNLAAFAFGALWVGLRPEFAGYEVFKRLWRSDLPAFFEIVRLGLPVSIGIIAEVGLFAFTAIMMGWLGEIALAAHGIALQIAALAFMVPLGLSNAATARAGIAVGRQDRSGLVRTGQAAVIITTAFALLAALPMLLIPQTLISGWLAEGDPNAAAVVAIAVPLLAVAACFQLVDGLQVIGVGLLRGLKDMRIPMLIAVFSYWAAGVPIALALGFGAGLEGVGIWSGLAAGLTLAAVLLIRRFFREAQNPAVFAVSGKKSPE
ncbi:MATE family efflux transporter [Salaquimonas pukyongi]|uniref:MATE family efflux transporter n=1 Tax=Salaquimonas pukyongi TaxID=2712698 RepID=UPI00096B9F82|nr:MATE family efflux transporter [Salaquimonas pukyongi]